jgi:hypothetical protein
MTGADLLALIKKQPIAFACAFVALACGVLFYFRSDALDEARQHFEAKDTEAKKMEVNVRHLAGLPEDTSQVQEAGRQFESRLVRAGQLATNLQFFYRIESETGVKLLDVRPRPVRPAPPIRPCPSLSPSRAPFPRSTVSSANSRPVPISPASRRSRSPRSIPSPPPPPTRPPRPG